MSPLRSTRWELTPSPNCEGYKLSKSSQTLGSSKLVASWCSARVFQHAYRFIVLSFILSPASLLLPTFSSQYSHDFLAWRCSSSQHRFSCCIGCILWPTIHPCYSCPSGLCFNLWWPISYMLFSYHVHKT